MKFNDEYNLFHFVRVIEVKQPIAACKFFKFSQNRCIQFNLSHSTFTETSHGKEMFTCKLNSYNHTNLHTKTHQRPLAGYNLGQGIVINFAFQDVCRDRVHDTIHIRRQVYLHMQCRNTEHILFNLKGALRKF